MDIAAHQEPGTIYRATLTQGLPAPVLRHRVLGPVDGRFFVVYACAQTGSLTAVGDALTQEVAEREALRLDVEQSYREEIRRMPGRLAAFENGEQP